MLIPKWVCEVYVWPWPEHSTGVSHNKPLIACKYAGGGATAFIPILTTEQTRNVERRGDNLHRRSSVKVDRGRTEEVQKTDLVVIGEGRWGSPKPRSTLSKCTRDRGFIGRSRSLESCRVKHASLPSLGYFECETQGMGCEIPAESERDSREGERTYIPRRPRPRVRPCHRRGVPTFRKG